MAGFHFAHAVLLATIAIFTGVRTQYQPTWDSLDSRPLPGWYDQAKFGIFLHWGVYSVPSFASEWFWWQWQGSKEEKVVDFMENNYPSGFTYADFAPMFKAEMFNPDEWADLFKAAGAQYVVLTSKHHEGWTNWPSKTSWNWNSVDNGPHADLVGLLANSIRKRTSIHFGLYFSLFEWFNPLYLNDKAAKFLTQTYVKDVSLPQLHEIVTTYQPELIWSDGDWEAPDTYWNSTSFLAWLYNKSPVKETVVVNDRWGRGTGCKHGGFFNCQDRYSPNTLQKHKWENAMTVDKDSWGYRRDAQFTDFFNTGDLIMELVVTVSCGGNLLLNVGPTHDGRIIPLFQERLLEIGSWLAINGEAIYNTVPWAWQNDSYTGNIWYTKNPTTNTVYATLVGAYPKSIVSIGSVLMTANLNVSLVGYGAVNISSHPNLHDVIDIHVPPLSVDSNLKWAWVFNLGDAEHTLRTPKKQQ